MSGARMAGLYVSRVNAGLDVAGHTKSTYSLASRLNLLRGVVAGKRCFILIGNFRRPTTSKHIIGLFAEAIAARPGYTPTREMIRYATNCAQRRGVLTMTIKQVLFLRDIAKNQE